MILCLLGWRNYSRLVRIEADYGVDLSIQFPPENMTIKENSSCAVNKTNMERCKKKNLNTTADLLAIRKKLVVYVVVGGLLDICHKINLIHLRLVS